MEDYDIVGTKGNPDMSPTLQALIEQLSLAMSTLGAEGTLKVVEDEFGYAIITIETRL